MAKDTPRTTYVAAPKPPTRELNAYGLSIFRDYYLRLKEEQDDVDIRLLEDYAYSSQKIREQEDELDGEPSVIAGKMGEKPNPRFDIIKTYEARRRKLGNELGIGLHTKKRIKRLEKSTTDLDTSTPVLDGFLS